MKTTSSEIVEEQNKQTNHFIRIVTVITASLILALVVTSLILQIKVFTILLHATDGGAKQRATTVVSSLAVENDCRNRRAIAGMGAPPDERLPCPVQTPTDVYPGARGSS